jgi:hypothetical protein
MHAVSNPPKTAKHLFESAQIALLRTLSQSGLVRMLWPDVSQTTKCELNDAAVLQDAHGSMRCGNPARSWRVLAEWLKSRGDQPQDYGWLSARVIHWEDRRVLSRLTEARVARLLVLKRSTEALRVVTERLTADRHFRLSSAADTLILAQIAARGGAPRISRALLSDFDIRFAGDPRVSISEALKRRLTQQRPVRMRA